MSKRISLAHRLGSLAEPEARLAALVALRSPPRLRRLVAACAVVAEALAAGVVDEWCSAGPEEPLLSAIEAALDAHARGDFSLLVRGHPGYPPGLATSFEPPELLFVRGELPRRRPALALVGSRDQAAYGCRIGGRFAAAWAGMGGVVVSGGARGVDAACHVACLDAGSETVAVLATGVDVLYPATSRPVLERVLAQGAIVSEWPPGTAALPRNFPGRNRIIAGLADAVVVVQAAALSGALHTATFALKSGRKLFTVPGPVDEPSCAGSVDLLTRGATALVGEAQLAQLFTEVSGHASDRRPLPLATVTVPRVAADTLDPVARKILQRLGSATVHVDELATGLNMSQAALSLALLKLELSDMVTRRSGNHFSANVRLAR